MNKDADNNTVSAQLICIFIFMHVRTFLVMNVTRIVISQYLVKMTLLRVTSAFEGLWDS